MFQRQESYPSNQENPPSQVCNCLLVFFFFFVVSQRFFRYEGVAERQNVSPHIKTMFRLKPGGGREVSWLYMGSHNLSKSSWGEEQLQGKQFKVLSFEIGVVFLPSLVSRVAGAPVSLVLGNSNALDARVPGQIVLPIPFRYPASPYSANYSGGPDDVPWQWDVPQSAPDVHQRPWPGIGSF